jgi:hypothetical protein
MPPGSEATWSLHPVLRPGAGCLRILIQFRPYASATALDSHGAVAEAVISKPLAVAFLDRAESVRRLKRLPVAPPPPGPPADTGPAGGPPAAGPAAAGPAAAVIDVAAAAITGVPCYADPGNAAAR